jgi:hypothetical protein
MGHAWTFGLVALALSGCALLERNRAPERPDPVAAAPGVTVLGTQAATAAALDTTTEAERAAALAVPASGDERALGAVVVALGPPAEQGLWLSTALVSEAVQGRIETAAGQSLALELRPGTGGALLSLAAFQALGLSLTELPQVTVYGP